MKAYTVAQVYQKGRNNSGLSLYWNLPSHYDRQSLTGDTVTSESNGSGNTTKGAPAFHPME